ncbi:MAG: AEC family transporter [Planctomycetia bacterium]|nr:AEC family transporter [Planctomycetia bacterium]
MNEIFETSLSTVISVYLIAATGMICRFKNWLDQSASTAILKIVINLLTPCLYISKIIGNEVFNETSNLYVPPLIGFLLISFFLIVTELYIRMFPQKWTSLDNRRKVSSFVVGVSLINYGYVPIPLIYELFPGNDRLLGILFVINLGMELALWSVCVLTMEGHFSKESFYKILNVPMLTICFALLLNMLGLDRFVTHQMLQPFKILSDAAIPLSLFIVGTIIAENIDWKSWKQSGSSFLKISFHSCFLRLFLFPLLIISLINWIPCSNELRIVMIIHASMASAIFPIILARLYHGDMQTSLFTLLGNTLPALITTPFWITIGLR